MACERKAQLDDLIDHRRAVEEFKRRCACRLWSLVGCWALKRPIIIGYLYGRRSVPDKVLDEARLLRLKPRLGSLGSTLAL